MKKLLYLEGLRGLAAIYVVIHHARWLLWEGYSNGYLKHPGEYSTMDRILMYFFSLFSFGHEMVIFFFVLSGFVIHLRYSSRLAKGINDFDFRSYFLKRTRRIYPPLLFALFVTWVLDTGGRYLHLPIYFDDRYFPQVINSFSFSSLLGNVAMIMKTYVPIWGSNSPLWSLKFEWWFYILYPLFFYLLKRSFLAPLLLQIALFLLSLHQGKWPVLLFQEIFSSMLIWWLGVVLADVYTKRKSLSLIFLSTLILAIPTAMLYKAALGQPVYDVFFGLGITGTLSFLFLLEKKGFQLKVLNKLSPLANFSYGLYILHMPILVFMSGLMLKNYNGLPHSLNYIVPASLICILFSYAAHFLIEKPFMTTRHNKKHHE